jgi:hypothetical protein
LLSREGAAAAANYTGKDAVRFKLKDGIAPRLVWSQPDSAIAPFCSACQAHIAADEVPLMMWNAAGACVQFCQRCAAQAVEVMT